MPLIGGYPTLAEFIARDRDAAIYHKFERLSARKLLYQQSELHDLEKQLDVMDQEEARNIDNIEARKAAVDWIHYSTDESSQAQDRRKLMDQIKVKIKEYHEALMLEHDVLSLSSPGQRTVRSFQRFVKPKGAPILFGHDENLFADQRDLVALAPVDTDRLNLFLLRYFGYFLKDKTEEILLPKSEGLYYVPDRRIQRAGLLISTLLSAILLVGAIACLLLVSHQRIELRVGMIVLFTCLFAAVVGLLTNARRAEIFASTAAYAAVLVVFISNFGSS